MPPTIRTRNWKRLLALPFALAAIAGSATVAIAAPRIQADTTRAVYTIGQQSIGQIYTSKADGLDQIKISTVPGSNYSPAPSPDGTKVVYTNEQNGAVQLYIANLSDGSGTTRLTDPPTMAATASWSRDGKKIAYASTTPGSPRYSIFSMNPDGSGKTALTPPSAGSDFNPVFSPDGKTLFFVRMTGASSSINSLALTADGLPMSGAAPKSISPGPFDGFPLAVGPTTVVYSARSANGANSWLEKLDVNSAQIEHLTSQTGVASQPHPAPNDQIVFTTVAAQALRLATMPVAGGPSTVLAIGGGDVYDGSYYPLIATPVAANPPPAPIIPGTAGSATTRSGVHLNAWEIAIGVVVVAGVAGGITYWVKLWPNRKKDDCDPLRIALAAARAEFAAAQTAMDQAEAAHNQATAATHQAEAKVFAEGALIDPNFGAVVLETAQTGLAQTELDTDKAAQEAAYKALTAAALRQGTARMNVDTAAARLAECEPAPAAALAPPVPPPPGPPPALPGPASGVVNPALPKAPAAPFSRPDGPSNIGLPPNFSPIDPSTWPGPEPDPHLDPKGGFQPQPPPGPQPPPQEPKGEVG